MSEHKEMKKTLKSPDKFQVVMAEVLDWMLANKTFLVGVGVAVVVLLAGMYGWSEFTMRQTLKLRNALSQIELRYQVEESKVTTQRQSLQTRIAEIDAKTPAADPKDKNAKKPELAPADKAARDALEQEMSALKADHTGTLADYRKFFDGHTNKPEGLVAGMRAATILIGQKKYDDARELITKIVDGSSRLPMVQFAARMILVGLLEESGKVADALKIVDAAAGAASEELRPQALFAKARLQLAGDAKDQARKTLDEIIEKYGQSQEAERARSMKAVMF